MAKKIFLAKKTKPPIITFDQLKVAAQEFVEVMKLVDDDKNPVVITDETSEQDLTDLIKLAITWIDPVVDVFTPETMTVIELLTEKPPEQVLTEDENKLPFGDDDEIPSQEEIAQKIHEQNIGSKIVTESPKEKKTKEKKPPEKKEKPIKEKPVVKEKKEKEQILGIPSKRGYTRAKSVAEVMKDNPDETPENIIQLADDLFVKMGGKPNIRHSRYQYGLVIQVLEVFKLK